MILFIVSLALLQRSGIEPTILPGVPVYIQKIQVVSAQLNASLKCENANTASSPGTLPGLPFQFSLSKSNQHPEFWWNSLVLPASEFYIHEIRYIMISGVTSFAQPYTRGSPMWLCTAVELPFSFAHFECTPIYLSVQLLILNQWENWYSTKKKVKIY